MRKQTIQVLTLRSAKSFVGQRVNVTLADCAVLVNVKLKRIDEQKRLVFEGSRLPKVRVNEITLISSAPPLWKDSSHAQNFGVGPVVFNAWRLGHRCGAVTCSRGRLGNRSLGRQKCKGCSFLQEAS
jgi:hypothetical protein